MKFLPSLFCLNNVPLVSGYERNFYDSFLELLKAELPEREIIVEGSNFIVLPEKEGKCDTILVAHYDQVGLVVDAQYNQKLYRAKKIGLLNPSSVYGKVLQSVVDGKIIRAVASSPPPHVKAEESRIFLELEEPIELAPFWPFSFENRMIKTQSSIFSPALDNRIGVICSIQCAKNYGTGLLLTAGEETGTTRLLPSLENIERVVTNPKYIVVDATFSKSDPTCNGYLGDGSVAFISIEGGGSGNIAPQNLVGKMKNLALKEIKTEEKDATTDATTFYRLGREAVAVVYPISYMHSSMEKIEIATISSLYRFLRALNYNGFNTIPEDIIL